MSNITKVQFTGLNALRFFAALAVMLSHSTQDFREYLSFFAMNFSHNLQLGVDLFFIISGFLIVYLLLIEKETKQKIVLWKFYARRALRIFPLYFLIIGIAFFKYHQKHPEIDFSYFLCFGGNFWMIAKNEWTVGILCPLWSICIEEHFYLIIPIIIAFTANKNIKFIFWSVIVVSILFRTYAYFNIEYSWMTLYCHTLSRCDLLALGGLLAEYRFRNKEDFNLNGITINIALLLFFLLICTSNSIEFNGWFHAIFKKYIYASLLLFLFVSFVLNSYSSSLMNFIKQNTMINYLGKISFGLYMFHAPICDAMVKFPFINSSFFLKPLIVFILTTIVAILSYELFEKRFLRYKTKFETMHTVIA